MDQDNRLEVRPLQKGWEKALAFAAYVLGIAYTLFAALRYALPREPFEDIIYFYGIGLAGFSVLSLAVFFFVFPETRKRTGCFLRKMLSYEQIFAALFFVWYIVVCAVWQKTEGLPFLPFLSREIAYTGISGLILFPMTRAVGKKKAVQLVEYLMHLVVLVYSCLTAMVLYRAFRLEDLNLPSGVQAGLTDRMQLVMGTHYNMTGAVACLMAALCLYMVFSQKLWRKVFYAVLAAMHLLVVILSNSRTDFIGAVFLLAGAAFCYSWYRTGEKKLTGWLRVLVCIAISGIVGLLFWLCREPVIEGFDTLTGFTESLRSETMNSGAGIYAPALLSAKQGQFQPEALAASAREITTDLNGRTDIWRAAWKVITHDALNTFFGVTPGGITDAMIHIGGLTEEFYGTHNAFLDVAAEFGVLAGIAFVVFAIRIVFRSFRILFRARGEEFKRIFMIPLTVFMLLVLNLTEGYLVAYFCVPSCVFYLFCGWIVAMDQEEKGHSS